MIHRLGMYYLAVQLQHDQDAAALRKAREGAGPPVAAPDRGELGMLLRTSAVVSAAIAAVALILWMAS